MARPRTDGLHYFPCDVDIFSDFKIKCLRARYGAQGIALYMYILCAAYRKSYYVQCDTDFFECAAADIGQPVDWIRQVVAYCVERNLFDKRVFTKCGALTSHGIQLRYQEARKSFRRTVDVSYPLWVLEQEETDAIISVGP